MYPDKRAEHIFNDALDLPEQERAAFITSECIGDVALQSDVQSLLDASSRAGAFLEGSAAATVHDIVGGNDPMIGTRIGAFRVVRDIGSGGGGRVYLAERVEGDFVQRVAIKLIHGGYDEEGLRRFRNECQVLAMLEHPNIARMIDGGFTPDSRPYIVMEYVDGVPIDVYCNENDLSVHQRIDLFRTVCTAVHHAHKHSTIHRDIKPGNILVDGSGLVKLVDFGIARVLDAADGNAEHTKTGREMLTPAYASPEQIRGGMLSTATDIYSLGVVLYKLLTDRQPYRTETGSAHEMAHLLESTSPVRPSEILLQPEETHRAGFDARRRSRQIRGDLDTIVLMAMRKEPERRYASVQEFSEDISRYFRGLPVQAQPDTYVYRAGKFARRNAAGVAVSVVAVVTLMAASVVAFSLYRRAETERVAAALARDEAIENERTNAAVVQFLTGLFDEANPEKSGSVALSARDIVDRGAARVRGELGDDPAIRSRVMKTIGDVYATLAVPDSARALLEEAIRIERDVHGDTHANLASALRAYGDLLSDAGDHRAALDNHLEALHVMERLYGSEDKRLPPFINRIALNNPEMHSDDKIVMFRRSLAIIEKAYGENHHLVAYYLINLAGALRTAGRYGEALALQERSLDIRVATLGADHALVATSLGSMASTLNHIGRYEEALAVYRRSLALREKLYGDKHPYVAMELNGMANAYVHMGRFIEARPLFERAIRIKEDIYGAMHPYIGLDEADLAVSYIRAGQPEIALAHLDRSLTVLTAAYGADHDQLGRPLTALGEAHAAMGDHEAAVEFFREALEVRARLGDAHPLIVETLELYATSLRALGHVGDAVKAEARARAPAAR